MEKMVLIKRWLEETKGTINYEGDSSRSYGKRHHTGFLYVFSEECSKCEQGYKWFYEHPDVFMSSTDFFKLRDTVKSEGYPWWMVNNALAYKISKLLRVSLYELR